MEERQKKKQPGISCAFIAHTVEEKIFAPEIFVGRTRPSIKINLILNIRFSGFNIDIYG
jgi:hypothetical protein